MKYSFRDGIVAATDTETGVIVKARMSTLRRQFYATGELPEVFRARRAKEIIGVWNEDRDYNRKAENGTKRHPPVARKCELTLWRHDES